MKRFLVGFLVGIIAATSAVALADTNIIRLFVDDREIVFDEAPPQIINGRTLVPARPLAEALGAKVTWDPETRSVKVTSQLARSM
ncbi:MAG: copper amine oxidase N-terminal domain-containing protein, partial [Sphaerochaeta sp.]|nr:copper amine oxidase N-terminal domain-containing protein [Sphaerochaeta sp.]